jgi:Beta protein
MDADHVQIPLLHAEPVGRLPLSSDHYLPALQARSGELRALANAGPSTWERLTPIIHLAGRMQSGPLSAAAVREQVRKVVASVGKHTVYLDTLRLGSTHPVTAGKRTVPLLRAIYAQARKRKMCFVPVAHAGESDPQHVELISNAILEDGHGVGIRYRLRTVVPPASASIDQYLCALIQSLGASVSDADLIVDLQYIDGDVELDCRDVARALSRMLAVGPWRSVVLLGTSMPSSLGEVKEGTIGSLPRREWQLWSELREVGLPRVPAYGDYAIQNPLPPNGGGPGMRANIRYTTDGRTLIARGHGPVIQEGSEQYRELCEQLVGCREFLGGEYTWGDDIIDKCATGTIAPGAQDMWRGAGTSHHLRFVTEQLKQMRAAP